MLGVLPALCTDWLLTMVSQEITARELRLRLITAPQLLHTNAVGRISSCGQLDTNAEIGPLYEKRCQRHHQRVISFQVAVQDTTGMQMLHSADELNADVNQERERQLDKHGPTTTTQRVLSMSSKN